MAAERAREGRDRGDAPLGDHLQARLHRVGDLGGDVGHELAQLGGARVHRRLAHDQCPQRRREAEHVAARGDDAAGEHLGRHEPRRADAHRAFVLFLVGQQARDAEVDEHHAVLAEDQILGLDVAVHDLLLVHVLERLARLARVLHRLVERQPGVAVAREHPCRSMPSTSCITRYWPRSSAKWSSTSTTRGWRSSESSRASTSKRSAWRVLFTCLTATCAPVCVSCARYTAPIAPLEIGV